MPANLVVADSVTKLPKRGFDAVLVVGSHGGVYAAAVAASEHPRGVIFNDAGIGLDEAGVAGLDWLDRLGCPACAVSADTARIGWGSDMLARGILSRVNGFAARLGCRAGQPCADAALLLMAAPAWLGTCPPKLEARTVLLDSPVRVIGLDSNSLVQSGDVDAIVITGSHGGLLGGRPESAIPTATAGAIYNDAGGGLDGAGMSRLPALDARGVPAATVASSSARIGDALSAWSTGRLSAVNALAAGIGIQVGQTTREFVDAIARARQVVVPKCQRSHT